MQRIGKMSHCGTRGTISFQYILFAEKLMLFITFVVLFIFLVIVDNNSNQEVFNSKKTDNFKFMKVTKH